MGSARGLVLAALVPLAVSGCKKESQKPPEPTAKRDAAAAKPPPTLSWYRGVVGDGGTEIPFRLGLPPAGSGGSITIDGSHTRVERRGTWTGDELRIDFELFNTRLEAHTSDDDTLAGTFTTRSPSWGDGSLVFTAIPISGPEAPLFPGGDGGKAAAVVGVYRLELTDSGPSRLVVADRGGELTGRIEFKTGNRNHMIGNQTADGLALAGFDGSSPYLVRARVDGDSIAGEWVAGYNMAWRESFVGKRVETFTLEKEVALEAKPRLDYKALGAERYQSKPLIVEVGGSWCPTCKQVAVVLGDIYRDQHGRGLEILTLLYEFTDDPTYNRAKAEQFVEEYSIPWEVRAMDGTIEDYWEILPDALAKVNPASFPVTLFVATDGRVIDFHAGFPAESDGREYEEAVTRVRELAARLLADR